MRISDWSSDVCSSDLTLLIEDGSADRLVAWHRAEAQARLNIAREILPSGADGWPGLPSYHLWVPLPGPWRPGELTEELRARGVLPIGRAACRERGCK